MDKEIKKPELKDPKFFNEPYDYRNYENIGHFCGVGEAGKVGSRSSSSLNAMPDKSFNKLVPRDHKG